MYENGILKNQVFWRFQLLAARRVTPKNFTEIFRLPLEKLFSKGDEQELIIRMLFGQLGIIYSDYF